jgi:hypothetical protein
VMPNEEVKEAWRILIERKVKNIYKDVDACLTGKEVDWIALHKVISTLLK